MITQISFPISPSNAHLTPPTSVHFEIDFDLPTKLEFSHHQEFLFQVKWMMYWIVFAFFTAFESVADIFVAFW